jgi:hypothetical protein
MKLAFRSRALLLMVGLVGQGLASCDDGIDGATASCRVYCDKLEMCDDGTDLDGCEKICTAQLVRSQAYLESRAQCASKLSCNVFAGEVSTMGEDRCASGERCELNDCTGDELARAKPTNDQQSYCSRAVTKLNACDRSLEPAVLSTHCLDVVPTLSDGYLQEVQVCIESDCAQVLGCLKRAADRFNTDLSLYPDPVVFD